MSTLPGLRRDFVFFIASHAGRVSVQADAVVHPVDTVNAGQPAAKVKQRLLLGRVESIVPRVMASAGTIGAD